MLLVRVYYQLKPWLPRKLVVAARRWRARQRRRQFAGQWPIFEPAGRTPEGWPGWPDAKRFAFVLTHDVESAEGVARVRQLAELEMGLGFRSSFNFVPEGGYSVPDELRAWLVGNGFEVGVHDLHHDGRLYRSRHAFADKARRVNRYLRKWNAVGFRSGFMLHNLDWARDLEAEYEASTFDFDPFEPQPDGAETIFPFLVPGRGGRPGYVELPYTLVQDFTLFVLLQESTCDIWKKKLDWVASRGGMALLNLHPDFVGFGTGSGNHWDEFPVGLYRDFLEYARSRYSRHWWQPLPREVARHVRAKASTVPLPPKVQPLLVSRPRHTRKIWIDLDNTPHVPFFLPIIRELRARGYPVAVTARDAFQVCDLADEMGVSYQRIGRHYGKNKVMKVAGLVRRSLQLLPFVLRERPVVGLSHGARSQVFLCNLFRIPTILIMDYEHTVSPPLCHPTWEIVPDALPDTGLHTRDRRIRQYPGIKEDVYAPEFHPDPALLAELGLRPNDLVVTVRPPATEAHYHNPEAEDLLVALMDRIRDLPEARVVMLPRNKKQEAWMRSNWPKWFEGGRTIVPAKAVNGLNLLWYSDLVVSGGGTMNREAAALGVPVYSIFRGPMGAVDRKLESDGRLVMIATADEVRSRIRIERRDKSRPADSGPRPALHSILAHVEQILDIELG